MGDGKYEIFEAVTPTSATTGFTFTPISSHSVFDSQKETYFCSNGSLETGHNVIPNSTKSLFDVTISNGVEVPANVWVMLNLHLRVISHSPQCFIKPAMSDTS